MTDLMELTVATARRTGRRLRTLARYATTGLRLGADARSRLLLATMLIRYKAMRASRLRSERVYQARLHLNGIVRPFWFRACDAFIVQEIFGTNPYLDGDLRAAPVRRILDLGAHIGLATLQFKSVFPSASVHCYEPDPENFELLRLNTQGLADVVIHKEAVGVSTGDGVLYARPHRPAASSLIQADDAVAVPCRIRSLDEILMRSGGADLVKFDIEGSEELVFSSSSLIHEVPYLVGELKATGDQLQHFLSLFPNHHATVRPVSAKMHIVSLVRSG